MSSEDYYMFHNLSFNLEIAHVNVFYVNSMLLLFVFIWCFVRAIVGNLVVDFRLQFHINNVLNFKSLGEVVRYLSLLQCHFYKL